MVSRDATTICKYTYSTGRERKNFFDLAQILGPLPKAWPGGAACSVDRSGEEDSQNRPFLR